MRLQSRLTTCVLLTLSALTVGCNAKDKSQDRSQDKRAAAPTSAQPLETYKHGDWWQDIERMNKARFNVVEILIAHAGVPGARGEALARGPEQALALATSLRDRLEGNPGEFAALAAKHTDRAGTAAWGGALGVEGTGGVPMPVVNALFSIEEKRISKVVRSEQGFHIVTRRPLPTGRVFGAEILIAHKGAEFPITRRRDVTRTRPEADELARSIVAQLNAGGKFDQFVDRSDARSAVLGGDLGAVDPMALITRPLVAHALGVMAVGATAVVETPDGFHVLLKKAPREVHSYAVREVFLSHSDAPLARYYVSGMSRAEAQKKASDLLSTIKKKPGSLDTLALDYCRTPICINNGYWRWEESRGADPEVEAALGKLPIGALVPIPIESAAGFHIVRRVDPAQIAARFLDQRVRPTAEDLIRLAARIEPASRPELREELADNIRLFTEDAIVELELDGVASDRLRQAADGFARDLLGSQRDPRTLDAAYTKSVDGVVGAARGEQLWRWRDQWLDSRLGLVYGIGPRDVSPSSAERSNVVDFLVRAATDELQLNNEQQGKLKDLYRPLTVGDTMGPRQHFDLLLKVQRETCPALGSVCFRYMKFLKTVRERGPAPAEGPAPGAGPAPRAGNYRGGPR